MSLDVLFGNAYDYVARECSDVQENFIDVIAEARNMPTEWIQQAQGIFIPNNEFMLEVFGREILEYDTYRNGICIWDNALIFPIRDVNDIVRGIAGFFPFEYVDEESKQNHYAYSSQAVFQKGRFMFFPQGGLLKSIRDEYILIVDGIFDAISLCGAGFDAAALMGSNVTPEIIMQLRFVKNVIVIADNDSSGYKLYDSLKKGIPNAILFKHGLSKDADDALKGENAEAFLRMLRVELIKLGIESTSKINAPL